MHQRILIAGAALALAGCFGEFADAPAGLDGTSGGAASGADASQPDSVGAPNPGGRPGGDRGADAGAPATPPPPPPPPPPGGRADAGTGTDADGGPPPPPADAGSAAPPDAGPPPPPPQPDNLLPDPGFERGESWRRTPSRHWGHWWARGGEHIHQSDAIFEPFEGRAALKLWGEYSGEYPNFQSHTVHFDGARSGDVVSLTGHLMTHADDRLGRDNAAWFFLEALDANGQPLDRADSDPLTPDSEPSRWHALGTSLVIPAGTLTVRAGVTFRQSHDNAHGSAYVDGVRLTSTGDLTARPTRQLVWHDEFDGAEVDETKWLRQVWPAYHVNAEEQAYTADPANAFVHEGWLFIRALATGHNAPRFTSGRLESTGRAAFRYGRIEAHIKVPRHRGTWPAFWMLPEEWRFGGWPDSGEIDIMEYVGCDPDNVHSTVHTAAYNHVLGTQRGASLFRWDLDQPRRYSVDWTPERIVFSVEDQVIFRFDNDGRNDPATWPFDEHFYIILNLAVGGTWGGFCGVQADGWPQELVVDYVRVYQTETEADP